MKNAIDSEVNDFESHLAEHGIVVVKFWLQLSKDEQLKRFKERQKIAYKRYKITDEDWRNREKWEAYDLAINEMVERTSTSVPGAERRCGRWWRPTRSTGRG